MNVKIEASNGPCQMCSVMKNGDKDKPIFIVHGPVSARVCGPHLHALLGTQKDASPNPQDGALSRV